MGLRIHRNGPSYWGSAAFRGRPDAAASGRGSAPGTLSGACQDLSRDVSQHGSRPRGPRMSHQISVCGLRPWPDRFDGVMMRNHPRTPARGQPERSVHPCTNAFPRSPASSTRSGSPGTPARRPRSTSRPRCRALRRRAATAPVGLLGFLRLGRRQLTVGATVVVAGFFGVSALPAIAAPSASEAGCGAAPAVDVGQRAGDAHARARRVQRHPLHPGLVADPGEHHDDERLRPPPGTLPRMLEFPRGHRLDPGRRLPGRRHRRRRRRRGPAGRRSRCSRLHPAQHRRRHRHERLRPHAARLDGPPRRATLSRAARSSAGSATPVRAPAPTCTSSSSAGPRPSTRGRGCRRTSTPE